MAKEKWKDIEEYEGIYQVSNRGRIRSFYNGRHGVGNSSKILNPSLGTHDRYRISLSKNGTKKDMSVARLVAKSFIPNPDNKPQVNHIDGDPLNNHVDNLEWCTQSENMKHAYENGLVEFSEDFKNHINKDKSGEKNGMSVLSKAEVIEIKSLLEDGELYHRQIAEKYGVSQALISMINNGQRWSHI